MTGVARAVAAGLVALAAAACQPGEGVGTLALTELGTEAVAHSGQAPGAEPRATADRQPQAATVAAAPPQAGEAAQHFIEFRAREGYIYGHTVAIYGRLNEAGEMVDVQVAGLTPGPESDAGSFLAGHVLPVSADTGYAEGDLDEDAVLARWRIPLTEDQYERMAAFVAELREKSPVWHATIYNCNAFAGDIARHLGLRTPVYWMLPRDYINALRAMNRGTESLASANTDIAL